MEKKYKIIISADTIENPSGVSTQTRYLIESLLKTKKFTIIMLGAAIKHPDMTPKKFKEFGEDFVLVPTIGYAPLDLIRQIVDIEKPDALFIVTDPRFYGHIFQNEAEIRMNLPILYWTIWDNSDKETFPSFNEPYYQACDFLGCINKATYNMMSYYPDKSIAAKSKYIPHGVPRNDYKILDLPGKAYKLKHLGNGSQNTFVVFYNSRNALRKRTNNAIVAFKRFVENNPGIDAKFVMHCSPFDPEGSNLNLMVEHMELKDKVVFNLNKVPNEIMAEYYNMADCTMQLSSEEGFGLAILESLMCGTPVICSRTGGMQDQALDSETGEEFGFCIKPAARSLIGSQSTPWVWSDHVAIEDATVALQEMYNEFKKGNHKKKFAGERARESMLRRFSLEDVCKQWEDAIIQTIETFKEKQLNKEFRCVEIAA